MRLKKLAFTMTLTAALMSGGVAALAATTADTDAKSRENRYERFVTDGVISQTTYEAIEVYLQENRPQKDENGTGEDGQRGGKNDQMLTQLVSAGTISQTTADAVNAYMDTLRAEKPADDSETQKTKDDTKQRGGMEDRWKLVLDAGVITQTEYDAIIAAQPEKPSEDSTDETAKTRPERDADGENTRTRMEEQLLSAGVITQTEYDAMVSAMEAVNQ